MIRIFTALLLFAITVTGCVCETVEPGDAGVYIVRGVVQPASPLSPGQFIEPCWSCDVFMVSTRQQTKDVTAGCFSSDLQEINVVVSVMYHIPESNVVEVYTQYHGDPFDTLVSRRVQESIKEATATRSAGGIVSEREKVKTEALAMLREKIGKSTVVIDDIVITDIGLSATLKAAIEAKMVQEQEAAKAVYTNTKAKNDAETARSTAQGEADAVRIRAEAEAKSIQIRGEALRQNPGVIQLQLIEKWDGVSPKIVGGGAVGVNIIMPATGDTK